MLTVFVSLTQRIKSVDPAVLHRPNPSTFEIEFTIPGVAPSWALYQKQTENPAAGAAPVPIMERRLNPLPAWILNVFEVPVVAAMLLLSIYATPTPGKGPVINSDWGLNDAPLVSVRVNPFQLASM